MKCGIWSRRICGQRVADTRRGWYLAWRYRRPAQGERDRVACRSQRGWRLGIRQPHTSGQTSSEYAILGYKILILELELLIDQPVMQANRRAHLLSVMRKIHHELSSSLWHKPNGTGGASCLREPRSWRLAPASGAVTATARAFLTFSEKGCTFGLRRLGGVELETQIRSGPSATPERVS